MLYCLTNNGELGKINEEIDNKASIDYVNWIDYKVYTVKDLIDRIEKCM